jgi:hypothetical protein
MSLQRLPVRSPHPGLKNLTRKLCALAQLRLQKNRKMLPTLAEEGSKGVLWNTTPSHPTSWRQQPAARKSLAPHKGSRPALCLVALSQMHKRSVFVDRCLLLLQSVQDNALLYHNRQYP